MVLEILLGVAGNLATDVLYKATSLARHQHNHDLQRALADAFAQATKQLAEQAPTEDARKVLLQLHSDARRLFLVQSDAVLDALLTGDEAALRQSLWECVPPHVKEELPDLERRLPAALFAAFGEVLKDERHQRAWIAFQRTLLQEIHRLMTAQVAVTATLTEEQRQGFAETLTRLDALARDTALLSQVAQTTAEMLSGIARVEVQTQTLTELMRQAVVRQQAQLDAILDTLSPPPKPKPDYTAHLQRLRERLRDLTARECALFRLTDFDPLTDALPLQLAECKPDSPFGLPSRDGERGAAEEILAKHPRLVIVADGGAGKTTLARRWACALTERALTDATALVPVYVEMNLYQQGELRELLAASAELDADTLQAELRAGRFALIFDGLNEVAADAYADAVRELRTLLSHDDGNRVLVTTRKHAYKDDLRLPTFAIEPLREDDIKAFVAARLGGEQSAEKEAMLAKQLLADARLRSLAQNPMMLTMLTAIVGQTGDIPRNRGQLFKTFVDGVFAWEEQSLKAGETRLDRALKEACLATIAYRLTEQGKVAADKLTIGNWIADKLDELRLKKLDWTDVYGELLRNGLLAERGREVKFSHEVFPDYFNAVEWIRPEKLSDLWMKFVNVSDCCELLLGSGGHRFLPFLAGLVSKEEQDRILHRLYHLARGFWTYNPFDDDAIDGYEYPRDIAARYAWAVIVAIDLEQAIELTAWDLEHGDVFGAIGRLGFCDYAVTLGHSDLLRERLLKPLLNIAKQGDEAWYWGIGSIISEPGDGEVIAELQPLTESEDEDVTRFVRDTIAAIRRRLGLPEEDMPSEKERGEEAEAVRESEDRKE